MEQISLRNDVISWSLGVIQPARAEDVIAFLRIFFSDRDIPISRSQLSGWLSRQSELGLVRFEAVGKVRYYSLQPNHSRNLPKSLRYRRDAMRLFLLKEASTDRVVTPYGEVQNEMGGVSPPSSSRLGIQRSGTNKTPAVFRHRPSYWSRLPRQIFESGRSISPYGPNFGYYGAEGHHRETALERLNRLDSFAALANMMGVSPLLISRMAFFPDRNYRSFFLEKKSGGKRQIYAPRVFLKTVQRYLNDYFFGGLPIHPSVHGFLAGRSIHTHSSNHVRQDYVGSIDVKNFFPSVTKTMLSQKLDAIGLSSNAIEVIVRLCTFQGHLPQGAPTSPVLANFCLLKSDAGISNAALGLGITYSRYADDLTFSGKSRAAVEAAMIHAEEILEQDGFYLNAKKSRINSRGGSQRVTGCIVNQHVAPPRKERRKVRAQLHKLSRATSIPQKDFKRLSGKVAFYGSFPIFARTKEYGDLLLFLTKIRHAQAQQQPN